MQNLKTHSHEHQTQQDPEFGKSFDIKRLYTFSNLFADQSTPSYNYNYVF